jgi:hypothetical protein
MSIDVCGLLSRGCKEIGGVRTRGYNVYRGFSWHTAGQTVRYVPVPATGTVYTGTGTVYEIHTRGIPVPNPSSRITDPEIDTRSLGLEGPLPSQTQPRKMFSRCSAISIPCGELVCEDLKKALPLCNRERCDGIAEARNHRFRVEERWSGPVPPAPDVGYF